MAPNGQQKVRLRCDDGVIFEITKEAAMKSVVIGGWLGEASDDAAASESIPVPAVKSTVLAKVIDYCNRHAGENKMESDFNLNPRVWNEDPFDAQFMADVDLETLFGILKAADFLNIKGLRELACRTVANMMREKPIEQIRQTFNIKNDYTPEEEQAVRTEVAWAFRNND